jgi:3-oxoacyl-[acyl-carrier protein] reductase
MDYLSAHREKESQYWKDQVVLVTGGSRGIGAAIAHHLAQLGAKVAINFVSQESQARQVQSQCPPGLTEVYQADVSDPTQVEQMLERIRADLGPISILVNNGGITADNLTMTMTNEQWDKVIGVHLNGAFYTTRSVLKDMTLKRHGRIINMASVSGVKGTTGQGNYSAAKAGLIGFSKAIAREMGRKKITCNAIALGVIDTQMLETLSPEVLTQYKKSTSVQRLGTTSEVANLVGYLAGPHAGFLTGQAIIMDGGMI